MTDISKAVNGGGDHNLFWSEGWLNVEKALAALQAKLEGIR
jgi:hypothetical protein